MDSDNGQIMPIKKDEAPPRKHDQLPQPFQAHQWRLPAPCLLKYHPLRLEGT